MNFKYLIASVLILTIVTLSTIAAPIKPIEKRFIEENTIYVNELYVGGRWKISYEEDEALVFRDLRGSGDKRFAMYNDRYVDIS
ncbi:3629_t:CDS:2 [Dentiscutata heterogama]|uniref:3629_t:CDS:1 n=1 Tax=Dentiscutata heterogama TaxID=1316150 RepID=A0ACA9L6H3_9GLOM|nr:3629_t:CDS:2 [Dentiscutata heterogama]